MRHLRWNKSLQQYSHPICAIIFAHTALQGMRIQPVDSCISACTQGSELMLKDCRSLVCFLSGRSQERGLCKRAERIGWAKGEAGGKYFVETQEPDRWTKYELGQGSDAKADPNLGIKTPLGVARLWICWKRWYTVSFYLCRSLECLNFSCILRILQYFLSLSVFRILNMSNRPDIKKRRPVLDIHIRMYMLLVYKLIHLMYSISPERSALIHLLLCYVVSAMHVNLICTQKS